MANKMQGGSCSDELRAHVDCAKNFLRAARFEGLRYEPGSNGEFDRCSLTRQDYVSCSQDPLRSAPGKFKRAASANGGPVQCENVKEGGEISRALSKNTGGKYNYDMPTVSGINGSYSMGLPKPCERELTHFGRCISVYMSKALQGGKGEYLFANPESAKTAQDKCFVPRTMFDQCAKQHMESGTEWGLAPSADKEGHTSRQSSKFARSFSTRGRTLLISSSVTD